MQPQDSYMMQPHDSSGDQGVQEAPDMSAPEIELEPSHACKEEPYRVQEGDTYADIAQALGITILQLFEHNPYVDASRLTPGQTLCIPRAGMPQIQPIRQSATMAEPMEIEMVADPQIGMQSIGMMPSIGATPDPQLDTSDLMSCQSDHTSISLPMDWDHVSVMRYYNVSYQALADANPHLDIEGMEPGQRLCVPASGSRGMCMGTDMRSYIMGSNETLDSLAWRAGVNVGSILRANPYLAPNDFVGGRTVCLPV